MKKILAIVLSSIMVLSLAACGSGSSTATAATEAAKTEEAAAAKTSDDAGSTQTESGDDTTLVYWSMWEATETQGIALQEAIDAFTAETGIKVDVQFKGRQGIRQGIQPALDADTNIDIFDEDVDRVNGNWGDYLLPLDDLIASTGYADTAAPAFLQWAKDAGDGVTKTIPYCFYIFCWHYNKDIFNEAGITATPQTWDEFLDVCQKIKDAGYDPICCDVTYETCMYGTALARLIGEDAVIDLVNNGNWSEVPEALEAAKLFEDLASRGYFSSTIASAEWPNAQNMELGMGTAGMYFNGSWLPNEIRTVTGDEFNWGGFAFPDLGGVDGTDTNNTSFQVFGINKKSAHPEEAFKLITWLTKGEWDQNLAIKSWGIPADTTNTEIVPAQEDFNKLCQQTTKRYKWAAGATTNGDISGYLKDNFAKLCGGMMTAEEFIAEMEKCY